MIIIPNFINTKEISHLLDFASKEMYSNGRQGTGYLRADALKINKDIINKCTNKIQDYSNKTVESYDAYFLKYSDGAYIPLHKDNALFGQEHHRINVILKQPVDEGFLFVNNKKYLLNSGDAYYFRPDEEEHEVTSTINDRIILTIGAMI